MTNPTHPTSGDAAPGAACPHEIECLTRTECQLRRRHAGDPAALRITTPGLTPAGGRHE